ncbi:MAG: protease modulator HflC [Elusimicrobiota bacterium]
MSKSKKLGITVFLLFLILYVLTTFYPVYEYQIVVESILGKPVRTVTKPGLTWRKIPWPIAKNYIFTKRLLIYNPQASEYLTADKQNVIVDVFVCWRIDQEDPILFLKSVRNEQGAKYILSDILRSEMGAALGKYSLENLVSLEPDKVKINEIMNRVCQNSTAKAKEYGISIFSVRMKRFNLPEQNKNSVYSRMSEERNRIAKKYRAEGEEQSMKIIAQADKEKEEIISKAKREAAIIKGEAEAEATRIYAEAYMKDPNYYKFLRTLEAYEKALKKQTTILLSPQSDFLKILVNGK